MRYEYIGGTSRKFWEIDPVNESKDHYFTVRVRFGRIGNGAQTHTKVFSYESAAIRYRNEKIAEKLKKGYKAKDAPKPIQKANPILAQATSLVSLPKPKPVCSHANLSRKNGVYECVICKSKVEFNEPQANVNTPEFEQKVRRFFAGAA